MTKYYNIVQAPLNITHYTVLVKPLTFIEHYNLQQNINMSIISQIKFLFSVVLKEHIAYSDIPINNLEYYLPYFELDSLFYALIFATFNNNDRLKHIITCPNCQNNIQYEYSIEDFLNFTTKNLWLNENPFNKCLFNLHINVNNTQISVTFYIPTIMHFFNYISNIPPNDLLYNIQTKKRLLNDIDEFIFLTKVIRIDNNEFNSYSDIKIFYENIPLKIFQQIKNYVTENILKYKLNYAKSVICTNCNTKINIHITPLVEFLMLLENDVDEGINKKSFNELVKSLLILCNNSINDVIKLLNMPYSIFSTFRNELINVKVEKSKNIEKMLTKYKDNIQLQNQLITKLIDVL